MMIQWQDHTALNALLLEAGLDIALYRPLLEIQSLTVGLESLHSDFSVTLLHLGAVLRDGKQRFSRQVKLKLTGKPVIAAESLCEVESQFWREYLNCGTQSLGRRLFNGENKIERSTFSYAVIDKVLLPTFAQDYAGEGKVIARRSIFHNAAQSLSLIEYYLPTLNDFNPAQEGHKA